MASNKKKHLKVTANYADLKVILYEKLRLGKTNRARNLGPSYLGKRKQRWKRRLNQLNSSIMVHNKF